MKAERMRNRIPLRSLTAKFCLIGGALFLFFAVYTAQGFVFSRHVRDDGTRINLAGSLRFRCFEMAWLLHRMQRAAGSGEGDSLSLRMQEEVGSFERTIRELRDGSRGLRPLGHEEGVRMLAEIEGEWSRDLMPLLLAAAGASGKGEEELLDTYDARVHGFVSRIDAFVLFLEDDYRGEVRRFDIFRLYAMLFFATASGGILALIKRKVVSPILAVTRAAAEMERGNLEMRVVVQDRDELGELGRTFNSMAQTLWMLLDEKAERLKELDTLNRIALMANRPVSLDELLVTVLDELLALEGLSLEKKGAILLCKGEDRVAWIAAARGFTEEQLAGCSAVPFGECLCGTTAADGEVLFSENSATDTRHTKRYSGMREHGHIVLPLKSREEVLGVVCLYLPRGYRLSGREAELYRSIADILSLALRNALALQESMNLASFPELSPHPIVECDCRDAFRIIYTNHAAKRVMEERNPDTASFLPPDLSSLVERLRGKGRTVELLEVERGERFFSEYVHFIPERGTVRIYAYDITRRKRMEVALRQSEEKHRLLFETMAQGIVYQDSEGRIIAANPAAERILGLTFDQMQGRTSLDPRWRTVHEDGSDFPGETHPSMVSLRTGEEVRDVVMGVFNPRDEAYRWLHVNAVPQFRPGEEKPYQVYTSFDDITKLKQAEGQLRESERKFKNLIETAPVGIAISTPDGGIVEANSFLWKMLRYSSKEEFLRVPFSAHFLEGSDGTRLVQFLRRGGFIRNFEVLLRRRDGTVFWGSVNAITQHSGEGSLHSIAIVQDITERKKAEEMVRGYTEDLEKRIRERTEELEVAKFHADQASRAKSDFLANMSHELRTPLNAVIGFSEILQDQLFGPLNGKQQEYVGDILESGRHLLSLINDILDLAKVESGKMELEVNSFLVRDVLAASIIMLKEKAMKHGVHLSLRIDPEADIVLDADERKVKQILFNLLSNAVKFTPEGGSVLLTARRRGNAEIEIAVTDTGIGIKPEDMPKLFKEFSQLESAYAKRYEGTGLGLALTRKLVELHGGTIRAESVYGKGSVFAFVLPLGSQGGIRG